ncbi:hypothetical protein D039_0283A, partial [Vibrio parahaemolyticus EKP-028]
MPSAWSNVTFNEPVK